jgi:hypothetical protein
MDDEISEKAKKSLADAAHQRAFRRLERDGAHTTGALQRRLRALVAERDIPPPDYAKLMHKRIITGNMLAFCKKHNVSADWLMCGDLKGLRRMKHEHKAAAAYVPTIEDVSKLYDALPPDVKKIVYRVLRTFGGSK